MSLSTDATKSSAGPSTEPHYSPVGSLSPPPCPATCAGWAKQRWRYVLRGEGVPLRSESRFPTPMDPERVGGGGIKELAGNPAEPITEAVIRPSCVRNEHRELIIAAERLCNYMKSGVDRRRWAQLRSGRHCQQSMGQQVLPGP